MFGINRAHTSLCVALCMIGLACSSTGATDDAASASLPLATVGTPDPVDTTIEVPTTEPDAPADKVTPAPSTTIADPIVPGPAEAVLSAHRSEAIQLTDPPPPPPTTTTTTTTAPRQTAPATTQPPAPQQPVPAPQPAPQPTTAPPDPPPATDPPPTAPPATNPPAPSNSNDAVAITNQRRAEAGLAPVSSNNLLMQAAASHSADQASRSTMTHTGSNGSDAGQRISALGYSWGTWGENVAAGYGSASSVMDGWMNSSGHRANILNPAFTEIGVASAASADGTLYWTMVLAAR